MTAAAASVRTDDGDYQYKSAIASLLFVDKLRASLISDEEKGEEEEVAIFEHSQ